MVPSRVDSLDKLCEDICTKYDIPDKVSDLRSLVQNELSTTITQFINNQLSTHENQLGSQTPRFIMSAPINDMYELSQVCGNDLTKVDMYVKTNSGKVESNVTIDDDGDEFVGSVRVNESKLIKIGTISRDKNKNWSIMIDKKLPVKYVDIAMYSRCWSCGINSYIRDFLNDIYSRINQIGKYTPEGNPLLVRESINKDDNLKVGDATNALTEEDEDITTYEIEYDPNEVIVYIHEYLEDDEDLDEDEEDVSSKIQSFFESIFGTDATDVQVISESVSKILFNVGASYVLGKGAMTLLNRVGAKIVSRLNPGINYKNNMPRTSGKFV